MTGWHGAMREIPDKNGPGWAELYEHELNDGRIIYAGRCTHPLLRFREPLVYCDTCALVWPEHTAIVPMARTWIEGPETIRLAEGS